MPRVVHFEIAAEDPKRAKVFYEKVFGWKIKKWKGPMEYWLITTGNKKEAGIDGALMKREKTENTINTIGVPSHDEFVKKIKAAGGKQVTKKTTIPGVGFFSYCQDPEGNVFGIMESFPASM
ncbi:MAG: VOC family protein [Conexivisphaerales archaeon]|jgi:predicted enzyme related to lactoylglutathione lyase